MKTTNFISIGIGLLFGVTILTAIAEHAYVSAIMMAITFVFVLIESHLNKLL